MSDKKKVNTKSKQVKTEKKTEPEKEEKAGLPDMDFKKLLGCG